MGTLSKVRFRSHAVSLQFKLCVNQRRGNPDENAEIQMHARDFGGHNRVGAYCVGRVGFPLVTSYDDYIKSKSLSVYSSKPP